MQNIGEAYQNNNLLNLICFVITIYEIFKNFWSFKFWKNSWRKSHVGFLTKLPCGLIFLLFLYLLFLCFRRPKSNLCHLWINNNVFVTFSTFYIYNIFTIVRNSKFNRSVYIIYIATIRTDDFFVKLMSFLFCITLCILIHSLFLTFLV